MQHCAVPAETPRRHPASRGPSTVTTSRSIAMSLCRNTPPSPAVARYLYSNTTASRGSSPETPHRHPPSRIENIPPSPGIARSIYFVLLWRSYRKIVSLIICIIGSWITQTQRFVVSSHSASHCVAFYCWKYCVDVVNDAQHSLSSYHMFAPF